MTQVGIPIPVSSTRISFLAHELPLEGQHFVHHLPELEALIQRLPLPGGIHEAPHAPPRPVQLLSELLLLDPPMGGGQTGEP